MGWEDRQYYRDRGGSGSSRLLAVLNGSVPLFSAFGIRVRAHAMLLIFIGSVILFPQKGLNLHDRIVIMGLLAIVVILHEFGHCFAARAVGGTAEDILLWPFGGLAMTTPPHRPGATFITVSGGPLVNVLICVICAVACWFLGHHQLLSLNPFQTHTEFYRNQVGYYVFWLYLVSYYLFLFNLLPIYPLDGGQMLQTALWPTLGYYKSILISCYVGMGGACVVALVGLLNWNLLWMFVFLAISGFLYCRMRLHVLKEGGEEEYELGLGAVDYSASLRPDPVPRRRRRVSKWTIRRLRRQAQRDAAEIQRLDAILAKVSAHGMPSLTWSERRALRQATERQRRGEVEIPGGE